LGQPAVAIVQALKVLVISELKHKSKKGLILFELFLFFIFSLIYHNLNI
jgi:hypothetical protein